ncbi:MAG: glutamyl-tRNA reductase, partial [Bacteroidota bacterium]
ENVEKRETEIPRIREIIGEELSVMFHWHSALQASPTITALTQLLEQIRKEEVEKNIHRFAPQDQELIELVTRRIVNKILHTPIVNLKNGHDESHNDRLTKINIVRKLFGLDARKERSHAG